MPIVVIAANRQQTLALLDVLKEQGYSDGVTQDMGRLKEWSKDKSPVAWCIDPQRKSTVEGIWILGDLASAYRGIPRVPFWEYVGPSMRGYNDD